MKDRFAIRLLFVAALAVVACGGYYFVKSFGSSVSPDVEESDEFLQDEAPVRDKSSVVLERNIFGLREDMPETQISQTTGAEVPADDEWALLGVFVSSPGAVVLKRGVGESQLVFTGQSIEAWLLEEITPRGAYWRKGEARRFTELFPDNSTGQGTAHAMPELVPQRIEPRQVQQEIDGEIARVLARNPLPLFEQATFKPAIIEGQHVGFFVNAIRPESPLAELGLQDKDILVRMGGVHVRDMNAIQQSLQRAASGESIRLDIIRDKNPISVNYNVR